MNIALVVPYLEPGGVETFLLRLASRLQVRGHAVTFVATRRPGAWWHKVADGGFVAVNLPAEAAFSLGGHARQIGRYLAEAAFDIILVNHARYAQAALGLLPDEAVVVPILHNDAPDIYDVGTANRVNWNVAVGVSPKVCQTARSLLGDQSVLEINYGVEIPSETRPGQPPSASTTSKLLFVGRLEDEQKGIYRLPEILQGLLRNGLDVQLTIAGDGKDRSELERRLAASGLQDRVIFVGLLSNAEVYKVLRENHILIMPSNFEGLPIIALESQACGCVPVATLLAGMTDRAIANGVTGMLVEPGKTEGFVDAIRALLHDPERWCSFSLAGAERARQEFSVDTMTQAYETLFRKALAGDYPLPSGRRGSPRIDRSLLPWNSEARKMVKSLLGFQKWL